MLNKKSGFKLKIEINFPTSMQHGPKISIKFITSIEQLKFIIKNEFKQVIDNETY